MPAPLPADARPRATAAWDASACARQDAAADVARQELFPQPAVGAERSAGRVRDVRERDVTCRRWERRAARVAQWDAEAPCIRV